MADPTPTPLDRRRSVILLSAVCVAAACAIIYELIIASMSSYLLGNSIYQFSITIGLFMTSMGLGSFLSKYVLRRLIDRFVLVEVGIGVLGARPRRCSSPSSWPSIRRSSIRWSCTA